jgi:hypothetical protein
MAVAPPAALIHPLRVSTISLRLRLCGCSFPPLCALPALRCPPSARWGLSYRCGSLSSLSWWSLRTRAMAGLLTAARRSRGSCRDRRAAGMGARPGSQVRNEAQCRRLYQCYRRSRTNTNWSRAPFWLLLLKPSPIAPFPYCTCGTAQRHASWTATRRTMGCSA